MKTNRKHKEGGWVQWAALAASVLGNMEANDQSEKNTATSVQGQKDLRATAYQDTVKDLQKAGLNPMLAYQNSATPTPQVPVAQNRSPTEGAANSAAAVAQMQNVDAQNDLLKAQAEKTRAETAAIPTSTANVGAQTRNLEAQLPRIVEEVRQIKLTNLHEEDKIRLTRQQKILTEIQQELAKGNISSVEAQTRTQNVLTELKKLEIPGAKNIAQWEESLGQYSKEAGAAGTAAKVLEGLTNSARKVIGK